MTKDKLKTLLKDRRKVAVTGLFVAFSVCFMLFIYAPLELYASNQTEFWFDFRLILKAVLENFAIFFVLNAVGILLAALLSKKLCRTVTALELVLLLTERRSSGRTIREKTVRQR